MPITQRMIHNSPAHLSSEFCDHSIAWRRRKTSHIGRWKVVGSECIEAKRMNINIRGPASILHLLAAPRSPNLDTLVNVSPGRKGRRIRGFAARSDANRTREDHCFPQPDYARPTSRQIFRSVAPSLIYIYIQWFTFRALVIHRATMEPRRIEDADFVAKSLFTPSSSILAEPVSTLRPGIRATSAGSIWEST